MIKLTARDGHTLDAYLAAPAGQARGGVVIAQEMYGVNDYLRGVCDYYAAHGYAAVAPALYDRKQRGLIYAYTRNDHDRAQATYKPWPVDVALDDLDAAREHIAGAGRVAIVGFCWGGSLAWLAACRRRYDASVSYYGSMMPDFAQEAPRCPVIAHIGDRDNTLPPGKIAQFHAARPEVPVHIYAGAQHGFDNPGRAERYDAAAHELARERTLKFLAHHVG